MVSSPAKRGGGEDDFPNQHFLYGNIVRSIANHEYT